MNNETVVKNISELVEGLNHLYSASSKLSQSGSVSNIVEYFEPIKKDCRNMIINSIRENKDNLSKEQLINIKEISNNTLLKFKIDKLIAHQFQSKA